MPLRKSLRTHFTAALATLMLLALSAAVGLALLGRHMRQFTVELGEAIESVRLAEELESVFRRHTRASNLLLLEPSPALEADKRASEAALRDTLRQLRGYAGSPEEAELLRRVEERATVYLASRAAAEAEHRTLDTVVRATNDEFEEALRPVGELVVLKVTQAREAGQRAARWGQMANTGGIVLALVLFGGVALLIVWIVVFALRPMFAVQRAMRQFGRGDRSVRAPERGPEELQEMARSFNEMADALGQQRDKELAFVAAVAHDLRNPLNVLRGSVVLAGTVEMEGQVQQILSIVRRQVDVLERMVGDLLDRAQVESGRLNLHLAIHDVRDCVRHVLELYDQSATHEIAVSVTPEAAPARIDPLRLEQVLSNLLSNALKYSPEGSRVTIRVGAAAGRAVIEVSDQGAGIAEADRERIFEPFRRTDYSRGHFPGSGLGLSAARWIARAHGGDIEVHGTPGGGATFRVWLPLVEVAAEHAV